MIIIIIIINDHGKILEETPVAVPALEIVIAIAMAPAIIIIINDGRKRKL